LKDCAPFASQHRAGDASAELQFRLGRSLLALGDVPGAQKTLNKARDLDTLRFRCDSRLNELIRKAAAGREGERVLLADAERSFAASSPDGLPGWDLFYEHVHLTFEGNCLLARTLAEQIEKLLPASTAGGNPDWPTIADCARRLGRTDRDLQLALADVLGRLTDPPFTTQINHDEHIQYLTQKARKAAARANVAGALQAAQMAVHTTPDDADLYEQMAALEQAAGHPAEAEAAALRAVDLLPSSEEGWMQLGSAFVQEKKYEEAMNAYQRAFDLNPQDVWPLQNVAMSLTKLGRNPEAMREYKRALSITPRFGLAWLGLGQLLESTGRTNEAADCYQKSFQNRIHRAPELATLARFCMSRGWWEAAATNFSDAIKLNPSDPALLTEAGQAHFLFGMALGKSGQAIPAAREFREAVRLMPDVVEARLNLGIALFRDKQWNDSLSEFEQVAARSPTNALARHYLALLRQRLGPQEQP
jgi:tetratricopeptide (TPR) repeat protein